MNKITLIGNLTADPVLRATPNGTSVCNFTLAVNRRFPGADGQKVTDFFNIVAWRGLADTCNKYLANGKKAAIVGLVVGTLCMTIFGSAFNAIYLLPKFSQLYGLPLDAIVAMGTDVNASLTSVSTLVLFAVVPFNILKGIVVSVVTMLLYKHVGRLIRN